jgi:hypothetical protein
VSAIAEIVAPPRQLFRASVDELTQYNIRNGEDEPSAARICKDEPEVIGRAKSADVRQEYVGVQDDSQHGSASHSAEERIAIHTSDG